MQRRATESLVEHFAALIDLAALALLRIDHEGVVTLCEGGCASLLERKAGKLIGQTLAKIPGVEWMASAATRALAGEAFRDVGQIDHAWLAVEWVPERDGDGAVIAAVALATDVTAEKEEELRLRQAEERYRRVIELAFEALVVHQAGVIKEANSSLARLFGYDSAEELIGRHVSTLAAPESRALVARMIAADSAEVYEAVGLRKDGSRFVGQLRGQSLGSQSRLVAIRDIERERILERDALEASGRLRAVIDSAPLVLFALDETGRFILSEGRGLRRLGLQPGEVVDRSVFDVYRDVPPLLANARRALAGEQFTADVEVSGMGGTWETTWAPLLDAAGHKIGTLGIALDVTARKRAEADREHLLREVASERTRFAIVATKLAAVLDCMVEAVVVCDVSGSATHVNRAARTLFGMADRDEATTLKRWTMDELLDRGGQRLESDVHPLWRALHGERVEAAEVWVRRGAEQRQLRASAARLADERDQPTGAVVVLHDVTEERALDRLKDEFLRVAAHELKTPVAVIKTAAQTAMQTRAIEPVLQRALERINRGADRIDRVVTDLLDMSQLQLGRLLLHPVDVDLGVLARDVTRQVADKAPRHRVTIETIGDGTVTGDRQRLGQVLTALVRNAIKYSPAGGEVHVTVTGEKDEVQVAVADRGVGIPSDRQARIFERFYTAHGDTAHDYGGMGIGLYLAREFVRRHGGRMWFQSQEGIGSTFFFALPRR